MSFPLGFVQLQLPTSLAKLGIIQLHAESHCFPFAGQTKTHSDILLVSVGFLKGGIEENTLRTFMATEKWILSNLFSFLGLS